VTSISARTNGIATYLTLGQIQNCAVALHLSYYHLLWKGLTAEQAGKEVMLSIRIQEVPCTNLGQNTEYPEVFVLQLSSRANGEIEPRLDHDHFIPNSYHPTLYNPNPEKKN
jgi:hypothetical protein